MAEEVLSVEFERLYNGGKYSADLYKIIVDGVERWYYYFDEDSKLTYNRFNEICLKNKLSMKNNMYIRLSRALQGDRATEELRFTKDDVELYDHFTGETRYVCSLRPNIGQ